MYLFLGIGDMPIYNFDKVLRTDNFAYMVVGWNERDEIEIPKNAQAQWEKIYNEDCLKTDTNESQTYYQLVDEIDYLENRYNAMMIILEIINEVNKEFMAKQLRMLKVTLNTNESLISQKDDLNRQIRAAKQKIEIREAKLELLKPDGEPISLVKQIVNLERITGIKIESRIDSVEKFREVQELGKEITTARKAS